MTMQHETAKVLSDFVDGRMSAEELEEWIVSISEDDEFLHERDDLTNLRLLLLESGDGLRTSEAARQAASAFLKVPHGSV
jgi:hypothetical protein